MDFWKLEGRVECRVQVKRKHGLKGRHEGTFPSCLDTADSEFWLRDDVRFCWATVGLLSLSCRFKSAPCT